MNSPILVPNFLPTGYTINDAIKKNENNICAFKDCNNKLSDPPKYGHYGVKICDECGKLIDDNNRKWAEEEWAEWVGKCVRVYKSMEEIENQNKEWLLKRENKQ